eukprot:1174632-Amorphochlora_amoeboformis.AAC.1
MCVIPLLLGAPLVDDVFRTGEENDPWSLLKLVLQLMQNLLFCLDILQTQHELPNITKPKQTSTLDCGKEQSGSNSQRSEMRASSIYNYKRVLSGGDIFQV